MLHQDLISPRRSHSAAITLPLIFAFMTATGCAAISAFRAPLDTRQSMTVLSAGTIFAKSSLGSILNSGPKGCALARLCTEFKVKPRGPDQLELQDPSSSSKCSRSPACLLQDPRAGDCSTRRDRGASLRNWRHSSGGAEQRSCRTRGPLSMQSQCSHLPALMRHTEGEKGFQARGHRAKRRGIFEVAGGRRQSRQEEGEARHADGVPALDQACFPRPPAETPPFL